MPYVPRHPDRRPCRFAFSMLAMAALFLAAFLVARLAHAAPPPGSTGQYHKWFESQVIPPGDPQAGSSCCAESDGHIIEEEDWRIAGGHYEVIIGGVWHPIPDSRVLPNSSNPTGKPVVWYLSAPQPHIFCFAPGSAT